MECWLKLFLPVLVIPGEWNKHNAEKFILDLENKPQTHFFKKPENICELT